MTRKLVETFSTIAIGELTLGSVRTRNIMITLGINMNTALARLYRLEELNLIERFEKIPKIELQKAATKVGWRVTEKGRKTACYNRIAEASAKAKVLFDMATEQTVTAIESGEAL